MISAVLAFLVVIAGAYYQSGRRVWQVFAVLIRLCPPTAILMRNLDSIRAADMASAIASLPGTVWVPLVGIVVVGAAVMVQFHFDTKPRGHR